MGAKGFVFSFETDIPSNTKQKGCNLRMQYFFLDNSLIWFSCFSYIYIWFVFVCLVDLSILLLVLVAVADLFDPCSNLAQSASTSQTHGKETIEHYTGRSLNELSDSESVQLLSSLLFIP